MSEAVEVTGADETLLEAIGKTGFGLGAHNERLQIIARHRHEATRALMAGMPTIMEDPAGKGYPCMERPMTPAEAKWALEDMDQRNVALSAQVEELREENRKLKIELYGLPNIEGATHASLFDLAKHKEPK